MTNNIETGKPYAEYRPSPEEQPFFDKLLSKIDYLPEKQQKIVTNTGLFLMDAYARARISYRLSGDPASSHPLSAAFILAEMKLPHTAIQMALLHDTVEDARGIITLENLADIFGNFVADGVNRIGVVKNIKATPLEQEIENERRDNELRSRLYEAVLESPYAALARFAERLHNLRTIKAMVDDNYDSARNTAEETIRVYAPLLWELGLFMANEMSARSLAVLNPDEFEIIDPSDDGSEYQLIFKKRKYPVFDQKVRDDIEADLKLQSGEKRQVYLYPPSLKDLGLLMMERGTLENIGYDEVPILADIIVTKAELDNPKTYFRMVRGEYYPLSERDLVDLITQIQLGGQREGLLHAKLIPLKRVDGEVTPVWTAFVTDAIHQERVSSIVDLYTLDKSSPGSKRAAGRKTMKVKQRLEEVRRKLDQSDPNRDDLYTAALEQRQIDISLKINGQIKDIEFPAVIGNSVMEVLAAPRSRELLGDRIFNIDEVLINGTRAELSNPILGRVELAIHTSETFQARPSWLRALRNRKDLFYIRLRDRLVDEIKEDPTIATEAIEITNSILHVLYHRKMASERYLSIVRGFDAQMLEKYGSDDWSAYHFRIDAGLGFYTDQQLEEIIDRIIAYRESLPFIKLAVPPDFGNQPGYMGIASSVLGRLGFNIVEQHTGDSEEPRNSAIITFYFEMPPGKKLEDVENGIIESYLNTLGEDSVPEITLFMPLEK